jgi:pimeloyl-ACP methyl ester carboxylesterase
MPVKATSVASRSGFAYVDGVRIAYQLHGDLSSGKSPLLVMHGSFMSGEAMAPLIQQFVMTRPVIAVDARGHGRTGDVPGPITHERMADDAAAVLRALDVRSADVLGYSMGGTTAIVMAVRHPGLVGKQVIVSSVAERAGWLPEVLASFAEWKPDMFAGTPIEREYRRSSATPAALPALVTKLHALEATNYDMAPAALRAIRGKTMVVVGDADGVALAHALQLFAARGGDNVEAATQGFMTRAPRARLAILPATTHVGMMSEAPLIGQLVVPFLDDRAPAPPSGFFGGIDEPASGAPAPKSHKGERQ